MNIQQIQEKLGFLIILIEPYYQSLELGYIPERVGKIVFLAKWLEKAVKTLGLGHIPITFFIGQTLLIAPKALF